MAKKIVKPEAKAEVKEEIVEQVVEEIKPEAKAEVKEAPEQIFYVPGYGNVIAKSEKEAGEKAKVIIAKIRG